MSKKVKRINLLIDILKSCNEETNIAILADKLNVSEMTIRRDLAVLQAHGMVRSNRGVVTFNHNNIQNIEKNRELLFYDTSSAKVAEKRRIAREAASLISPGDTVIIDTGTTTGKILKYLPPNYPVTVICSTMNSLYEAFSKNFESLIFAGGYYHSDTETFESKHGCALISSIRASKYFVSALGVNDALEITTGIHYEIDMKRASLQAAQTKILTIDSSKFGRVKAELFMNMSDIDIVITDKGISDKWIKKIEELNIQLLLV